MIAPALPLADPQAVQLFNEIAIIEQLSRSRFARVLPPGMTLSQFGVLNHFARLGGEYAPAALAAAFQVTRQTMTNTLQKLEAANLVALRPDPDDGRAKIVAITALGIAMRAECLARLAPVLTALDAIMPASEIAAMLPRLRDLRQRLDAARGA